MGILEFVDSAHFVTSAHFATSVTTLNSLEMLPEERLRAS